MSETSMFCPPEKKDEEGDEFDPNVRAYLESVNVPLIKESLPKNIWFVVDVSIDITL
jgi:hypothetical protein